MVSQEENMSLNKIQPLLMGIIGSLSLLAFYLVVMLIFTGSLKTAYDQFISLWYLMTPLIVSFGIQTGLYQSIRHATNLMKGTTTTSTVGMVACCAHHLTEILPILGLSAISVFLVNYQTPILILSILLNLFGIIYLLRLRSKVR